jgi:hypothetical protein
VCGEAGKVGPVPARVRTWCRWWSVGGSHAEPGKTGMGGPVSWASMGRLEWAGSRGTMMFCNYSKNSDRFELI